MMGSCITPFGLRDCMGLKDAVEDRQAEQGESC
jgi:hypothetical protein